MAVSEDAAQLRLIAADMPLHEQQEVTNRLEQLGARVAPHLGSDHPGYERIQAAVNNAMSLSSDAYNALELLGQTIVEVAQGVMRG